MCSLQVLFAIVHSLFTHFCVVFICAFNLEFLHIIASSTAQARGPVVPGGPVGDMRAGEEGELVVRVAEK